MSEQLIVPNQTSLQTASQTMRGSTEPRSVHFSFSSLCSFNQCPMSFYLNKILH